MKDNFELHLMMGLPGSGKTTYVNNNAERNFQIIDLDSFSKNRITLGANQAARHFALYDDNVVWVDGLILTKNDIENFLDDFFTKFISIGYNYFLCNTTLNIKIHQFEYNIENCKNNDVKRVKVDKSRDISSTVSIDNMNYDIITEEDINEFKQFIGEKIYSVIDKLNCKLEYECLPVKKCGNWDLFFKQSNKNPFILQSVEWSLGGTWCDYNGNESIIEPEQTPEFVELDNILANICPNLSFFMYKKIYRDFVEIKRITENDYYGGTEYRAYYEADMKGIYDMLVESKIIEK